MTSKDIIEPKVRILYPFFSFSFFSIFKIFFKQGLLFYWSVLPSKRFIRKTFLKLLKNEWKEDLLIDFFGAGEEFIRKLEISIVLCDDSYMRELNKVHRNKDKTTDVLSFPNYDFPKGWGPSIKNPNYKKEKTKLNKFLRERVREGGQTFILGDIVISIDTCIKQALEFTYIKEHFKKLKPQNKSKLVKLEIERLLAHGLLHLLGYDHELSPKFRKLMFERENAMLGGEGGGVFRIRSPRKRGQAPYSLKRTTR